jgi:hypothetical protein
MGDRTELVVANAGRAFEAGRSRGVRRLAGRQLVLVHAGLWWHHSRHSGHSRHPHTRRRTRPPGIPARLRHSIWPSRTR